MFIYIYICLYIYMFIYIYMYIYIHKYIDMHIKHIRRSINERLWFVPPKDAPGLWPKSRGRAEAPPGLPRAHGTRAQLGGIRGIRGIGGEFYGNQMEFYFIVPKPSDIYIYGGFLKWGYPNSGCIIRENTIYKWMITRGNPCHRCPLNSHCLMKL